MMAKQGHAQPELDPGDAARHVLLPLVRSRGQAVCLSRSLGWMVPGLFRGHGAKLVAQFAIAEFVVDVGGRFPERLGVDFRR